MKNILDWKNQKIINTLNDIGLWSAPFGRLLLENIPMQQGITILDIGFGTGFPLIELSQRFGETSKVYGIDIWEAATNVAREKISTLDIKNIEIIEESASKISINDAQIDLITSNLGVNNFDDKEKVYSEIYRVLKPLGRLCITTNTIGTFQELFDVFDEVLQNMNLQEERGRLKDYLEHRNIKDRIIKEFDQHGLKIVKSIEDSTNMRFANAEAILNHSLIRMAFRGYWADMIREEKRTLFFENLIAKLEKIIDTSGQFIMGIPILYLEFEKNKNKT